MRDNPQVSHVACRATGAVGTAAGGISTKGLSFDPRELAMAEYDTAANQPIKGAAWLACGG